MAEDRREKDVGSLGLRASLIIAMLALLGALPVYGAVFDVTTTDDTFDLACDAHCSLRDALAAAAQSASDDEIVLPPGTYSRSGSLILRTGTPGCFNCEGNLMPTVFGQGFRADGSRRGGEFQVNTYTSSRQQDPAIALAGDEVVVVWADLGRDQIFGQRFQWSLPDGSDCTQNADCSSGHCVDRICCESPCEGDGTTCTAPGFEGTCVPDGSTPTQVPAHTATESPSATPSTTSTATASQTPTSTRTPSTTPTNTASISPRPTNTSMSPTTTRGASILFFPALVADETRDSLIQITNLSSSSVYASCFYISSSFQEIDFLISLGRFQPTQWVLSQGRFIDPDDQCESEGRIVDDCSGAGVDPGIVPPVTPGFRGELLCVEIDVAGSPIGGNHLRGQTTILDRRTAGVGKYSAIGFIGSEIAGETGNVLRLEGKVDELKGQYDACPESWILNHAADSADNGIESRTCLTVAACSLDLETQEPETVEVELVATNDLGQTFTASTTIAGWAEICLSDLDGRFLADFSGASQVQTRVRSAEEDAGIIVVAKTVLRADGEGERTSSAANLQSQGARSNPDTIVIPFD